MSILDNLLKNFIREFPLVLSHDVLCREVPYKGTGELDFYVEGLRFPDKDFDGLVTVSLSLLEPCSQVSSQHALSPGRGRGSASCEVPNSS